MEGWDNRQRLHSAVDCLSAEQYEQQHLGAGKGGPAALVQGLDPLAQRDGVRRRPRPDTAGSVVVAVLVLRPTAWHRSPTAKWPR